MRWDHPRGCGEHLDEEDDPINPFGSSPRMRGAQSLPVPLQDRRRIIPADAGSTAGHLLENERDVDHPRGCGEHGAPVWRLAEESGSSPRMRGAPVRSPGAAPDSRIIPADAGSTQEISLLPAGMGDHPRGCGEHLKIKVGVDDRFGSSPRRRGAPSISGLFLRLAWIIPADAGSTSIIHGF